MEAKMGEEYGWRARIGLLAPLAQGCTPEAEFRKIAPKGVEIHSSRMPLEGEQVTEEALKNMELGMERAALEIAKVGVDVIVYACTAGSMVKGVGYDREIIARIEALTGGIKATTMITSVLEAMKTLKMKRIVMVTPYTEDLNEKEIEFLKINGIEVIDHRGKGIVSANEIARITPGELYRMVKEIFRPDADGIFISCGNLRTFDIIDALETDMDVPVVTSNLAISWEALRLAGVKEKIKGYGRLLWEH